MSTKIEALKAKIRPMPYIPVLSGFMVVITLLVTPLAPIFTLKPPYTTGENVSIVMPWRIVGKSKFLCAHYMTAVPDPENWGDITSDQREVYSACDYAFTPEEVAEGIPRDLPAITDADADGFGSKTNLNRYKRNDLPNDYNPYEVDSDDTVSMEVTSRSLLNVPESERDGKDDTDYDVHALDSIFRHVDRPINFIVPSELQFGWIALLFGNSLLCGLILAWYVTDHKKLEAVPKQKILKWEKAVQFTATWSFLLFIGCAFVVSIYEDDFSNKLFEYWTPSLTYYVFMLDALLGLVQFLLIKLVREVPKRVTERKKQIAEAEADAASELALATI